MPEIGGYFPTESWLGANSAYHHTLALKSGRAALLLLLQHLKPTHAWLPRYTCGVVYHPFETLGIPYSLYSINEQAEPIELPAPQPGHLLLYINYNDACRPVAEALAAEWQQQLIIDNTQAFGWQPRLAAWSFNSARKWMGVADGAYLFAPSGQPLPDAGGLLPNTAYTTRHLELRRQGHTQEGYPFFQENERLCGEGLALMSAYSHSIVQQADVPAMLARRKANYQQLHQALQPYNQWQLHSVDGDATPMYYPFLPSRPISHEACWQQQFFVPRLWAEVQHTPGSTAIETQWAQQLLPLPIDHRYNENDMQQLWQWLLQQLS